MSLSKEEVFAIMGKYYGNAYYKWCANDTEHDLLLDKQLLDEINALGYCFSNTHRLTETADVRIPQILCRYIGHYDAERYSVQLIQAFAFKEYHEFVPYLLELYDRSRGSRDLRSAAAYSLFKIKAVKYSEQYLELINSEDYVSNPDQLYDLVCRLRIREAIPRLIELLHMNTPGFINGFLENIWCFRDPALAEEVKPFLDHPNGEFRAMAKKCIMRMQNHR